MRLIWIALLAVACSPATEVQDVKRISNLEMKELMKDANVQIVDVRTPGETAKGIIEGAEMIDFHDQGFVTEIQKLDKEKPIVVYCAVGGRSASASDKLKDLGFKEIYDLKNGYRGWVAEGNPTK